jgi:predicted nuclease of predicted toxin-antitoxin system
MSIILIDHDIEGQAMLLWAQISSEGWPDLISLRFVRFIDVDLPYSSTDREVWRFAQQNDMILLTGNRNMKDEDSLEKTIRDENTPTSLPVLTVGNVDQMVQKEYRDRCESRLLEIVLYLDNYLGAGRLFIP